MCDAAESQHLDLSMAEYGFNLDSASKRYVYLKDLLTTGYMSAVLTCVSADETSSRFVLSPL